MHWPTCQTMYTQMTVKACGPLVMVYKCQLMFKRKYNVAIWTSVSLTWWKLLIFFQTYFISSDSKIDFFKFHFRFRLWWSKWGGFTWRKNYFWSKTFYDRCWQSSNCTHNCIFIYLEKETPKDLFDSKHFDFTKFN